MPKQIQGSQTDFSYGEIDVVLKRADDHPARKAGLRQLVNARILNSGAVQNRPGRRALFLLSNPTTRVEEVTMSAGHLFYVSFAFSNVGYMRVYDSTGALQHEFNVQGNGALLPWDATGINHVVYAVFGLSIYITYPGMRPQVVSWDGVATWTITDYAEQVIGPQKRTPFYRISPQGIAILPSAQTGAITLVATSPLFTAAWVGTRIRYINRQILITGFTDSTHASGTVQESLPGSQVINFTTDPTATYNAGDVVIGSVSGSKAIVVGILPGNNLSVQLISTQTSSSAPSTPGLPGATSTVSTLAFVTADYLVGPGGSLGANSVSGVGTPQAVAFWDQEVMNGMQGYPASCFTDQFRVGFCDFPSVPGGIAWSAINSPTDLYVGATPDDAMFEIAPSKTRVRYVVPGPESSEFVFCDTRIYYIPITTTNPLKPGSVGFQLISSDGCARVQPRVSQEIILYVNAGQNSVMAIIATGAYNRPFNTKNLSDYHAHLFSSIVAIAVPTADGSFNERYAYVLNADGSVRVGKYTLKGVENDAAVGWGPWSGVGAVHWIAAWGADVLFSTAYATYSACEILDDENFLDTAIGYNGPPAAIAAGTPPGFGPLWFAVGQTTTLIDQGTRFMGTYDIDASGFLVPQNNAGEDFTSLSLVAGQPWTATVEPFAPDAPSGADQHQRMGLRQFSNFAVYVLNSTGFIFQSLFSGRQTATSPAPGTVMSLRRVPAWNQDDDPTLAPPHRETVESWTPPGSSYDPRCALVKDTPGPWTICEIAMEVSL